MDFAYSEDQEALRELARKILEQFTGDRLKDLERDPDSFDRKVWRDLAQANLLGASLGEDVGGSGLGIWELSILLHEVGRSVAPLPLLPTLALAALPIERFGSEAQRQRYLPGVVSGEQILTGAFSEPQNDDPARPSTTARRDGERWRLDGVKTCVPAAQWAHAILVPASIGDGNTGLFVVEPGAAGVSLERQVATSGELQGRLEFSGAEAVDLIGETDPASGVVRWSARLATLAYCWLQHGVLDRMLRMTAEYVTERRQFERPIGSFQAVHQRAADAFIHVQALELALLEATYRFEQGLDAREAILIAKYWASGPAFRVAYACNHLHGGIGIDVDYPLHRYYQWAKQIELCLGAGPVQLRELGALVAAEVAPAEI
ncbi:MAG: acyl-CoA/acyl-ACP dehydrogenase [Myxococcales bacterium]|nr:acyl-CoA/acyl-ACP dehydrogenase [Myxococcales bacterium]